MNGYIFLDAMENIRDEYIVNAQQRLGYVSERNKSRGHSMKRIFTVVLAAVLVLLTTMAVAMAVSPEFREAIISLFQIGEVEQVPEIPAAVNEVRQVTIGSEVSAQYVKVQGVWLSDDGDVLLRQYSDDSDHFYDLKDDELVEVGIDAPVTTSTLYWQGRNIDVQLRWLVYNGRLYLHNGYDGTSDDGITTVVVNPERLGSRTDVAVLRGECYGQTEANWAWICDLETGEVWDVLAGCGIETLGYVRPVLFAEDLKHALVRAGNTVNGTPYLIDLEGKTCTPLSELFGMDIDEDSFGSYEVSLYDNDTVMLAMAPLWQPESSSVWTYHIPSGTVTPTVVDETGLEIIPCGEPYRWTLAQKVDEDGLVTIVNLRTGGQVKLEGITAEGHCYLKANSSQTKLLWVDWGDSGLNRLGVIDLENGEFTAFERAGRELRYNQAVFWLDDDRVVAMMDLHTGEGSDPNRTDEYYLCVYEF